MAEPIPILAKNTADGKTVNWMTSREHKEVKLKGQAAVERKIQSEKFCSFLYRPF